MDPWLENFARANFRRSSDTAHDLKTPLNVAVLNLELLRMRAAEARRRRRREGRRPTRGRSRPSCAAWRSIFDAFFLLSTPPKNDEPTGDVDLVPDLRRGSALAPDSRSDVDGAGQVAAHESRIRQAFRLFFEGAAKSVRDEGRTVAVAQRRCGASPSRSPAVRPPEDFELTKIFKFYYTDAARESRPLAGGCAAHRRDVWW